jgi:glycine/D-amino acid oxidase-like deaminating enzyme
MPANETYRSLSYWLDSVPGPLAPTDPLPGDLDVDVAIAGAGLTGLWTAYYLAGAQPGLRVAVCEADIAGFGASGRNGGWCSALFPASLAKLTRLAGRDAGDRHVPGDAADRGRGGPGRRGRGHRLPLGQGRHGGTSPAPPPSSTGPGTRSPRRGSSGFGEEDLRLLTAAEAREQAEATDVLGATYTPHCAAIHPARLVRGLAEAVRRRGVAVHEATPGHRDRAGPPAHADGNRAGRYVIRATEGYTPRLPGLERAIAPVYSLMIATEPLPEAVWAQIGLTAGRPSATTGTWSSTASARRTGGWRSAAAGAPYHLGSAIRPEFDRVPAVFESAAAHADRPVPGPGRREGDAHLGRPAGHPARLVRVRRAGPGPPGSAGPAATSATASPPPTWPGGPWPT